MHFLHDDFMGLYHTIRMFSGTTFQKNENVDPGFGVDRQIQFLDDNLQSNNDYLYEFLTKYPLRYKKDLRDSNCTIRFNEAIVGISTLTTWYQYGFKEPQGPIEGKKVSGLHVRQVANFIMHKLKIEENSNEQDLITILSRKSNRLIINEEHFSQYLASRFPKYNLTFIRNEELSLKQQIEIVLRSKILIGMHGSILILSMFLPPGSILIELYPYAITPENYTPYKTLCSLSGYDIIYKSWANLNEMMTVTHPDYPVHLGGIDPELDHATRDSILQSNRVPVHLCCSDPQWLFRIYQDTLVNLVEVGDLVEEALIESQNINDINPLKISEVSAISDFECIGTSLRFHLGTVYVSSHLTWSPPWNTGEADYYIVHEMATNHKYNTSSSTLDIDEELAAMTMCLRFLVIPYKDNIEGSKGGPYQCLAFLKLIND